MSADPRFDVLDTLVEKRQQKCRFKKLHHIKTTRLSAKDFPSHFNVRSKISESPSELYCEGEAADKESVPGCLSKSPITFWRIADRGDIETIYDLVERSDHVVDDIFSQQDIPNLIEKSVLALVQFNSEKEMVSFTCAFSYPHIPAVPSFDWFVWMENMYQMDFNMSPRNCVFIHYMIWRTDYYEEFLALTLETIFMEFPFLKNIIITRPPLVKIPDLFAEYFIPVLPKDAHKYKWEANSVQTMLVCLRHSLLERLKIRLAIVEDHDDLMPIIERQTDKLRTLYGDFCMAEIIEYPGTEDRKTLVCEVMGKAVALMNLNRAIDLELLNTQFDLGVFHGLRKPTDDDKSAELLEEDEHQVVMLPDTVQSSLDVINSDTMQNIFNWKPSLCQSEEGSLADFNSTESEDGNELPTSVVNLIRDSLQVKINPKFSAYALASNDSEMQQNIYNSEYGEGQGTVKTELSLISLQYYNLPEYHGPPNAFCIELFAVHEDFDERLCTDFLEAAFELFPDLEYCLLTIPSQCVVFPLLDIFVRVTPRPLKRFKQELYVCHKSSVMLTLMRVRKVIKADLKEIYTLLKGINKREFIYADIANSCLYPESAYQGFVLVCNRVIVGVAVVCNENGMEYLTEHYHVGDLIDFELHKIDYHAILKHLALSPIYQTHARFFLRDVMRMADITALYRARYEEVKNEYNQMSLITVIGQLVPVKPRRMVKYHEPSLDPNMPPSYLLSHDIPFALYHINSRICGVRKLTSNINLVVVGASRTAYSFLENLLYGPNAAYVTYNNITWVSPHGMGLELAAHDARDLMFPYRGKYNRRYKAQISLHSFVNFVYGVMTEINRIDKYIRINNDAILRYDYLVLLCGKQYLMPIPYTREPDLTKCSRGNRARCSLFKYLIKQKVNEVPEEAVAYPSNVFLINSAVDATNAVISLQYLMRKRKNVQCSDKIIIYGLDLISYLSIQSLLKFGIPAEYIVLVEPPPKNFDSEKVFMDPNVDAAVAEILKEMNIAHYRNYVLYDWTFCHDNQINTATFHSKNRKVTLKCMAMFPFEEKLVSDVTFKAVNEASLVYDGKLVINHNFQTNDPYIYSAGPFTKYQRKYYAKDKHHELYSSAEVGKMLAEIIRVQIDPTEDADENELQKEKIIPKLTNPLLVHGQLPGDWNYCHVRNPGKIVPLEVHCNIKEYGDTLITGDCSMSKGYGYFRIHLDDYGFVKTITCFTKDEIDIENLPMLYGKHEKYLNNLLLRYDLGMITDFYAYFRQPWVYALYHDKFKYLMDDNNTLFTKEVPCVGDKRLVDIINEALKRNKWERLSDEKLLEIKEMFDQSEIKEAITRNVVDYLTAFDNAFPMYASPGITRVLLRGANTSLLHKSLNRTMSGLEYKSTIKISDAEYHF